MADEYIRRDDFIQHLEKCKKGAAVTNLVWAAIMAIERDVRDMPAADVAPVVHGRWVDNGIPGSMLSGCSMCGFTCGSSSFFYCPICGARMRRAKRGKVRRKYGEILKLHRYCVDAGMDVRLERMMTPRYDDDDG